MNAFPNLHQSWIIILPFSKLILLNSAGSELNSASWLTTQNDSRNKNDSFMPVLGAMSWGKPFDGISDIQEKSRRSSSIQSHVLEGVELDGGWKEEP